jgi:hypothetical protein
VNRPLDWRRQMAMTLRRSDDQNHRQRMLRESVTIWTLL